MRANIILFGAIAILCNSCYMSKNLETTKTIRLELDNMEVFITGTEDPYYMNNHTKEEYTQAFISGLKENLAANNMKVAAADDQNPNYTLNVSQLMIKETIDEETVDDESSEYHGTVYQRAMCWVEARMILYKGIRISKIEDWTISADKEEKVTNNRNFGDYVFGTNKDNKDYRLKSLSENIFMTLSTKCGRRTCAKITSKVAQRIKKGKD